MTFSWDFNVAALTGIVALIIAVVGHIVYVTIYLVKSNGRSSAAYKMAEKAHARADAAHIVISATNAALSMFREEVARDYIDRDALRENGTAPDRGHQPTRRPDGQTPMIRLAAILILFALIVPALAHDNWIMKGGHRNSAGEWCCGEGDCFIIPKEQVRMNGKGYVLFGHEQVLFNEVQPSPDGAFWRCKRAGWIAALFLCAAAGDVRFAISSAAVPGRPPNPNRVRCG